MHTHFSVLHAAGIFTSVLVFGTAWRLASVHLVAQRNPTLKSLGRAMAFQY